MITEIRLSDRMIAEIETALAHGKRIELAERNGNVVMWFVSSKKHISEPIVSSR